MKMHDDVKNKFGFSPIRADARMGPGLGTSAGLIARQEKSVPCACS